MELWEAIEELNNIEKNTVEPKIKFDALDSDVDGYDAKLDFIIENASDYSTNDPYLKGGAVGIVFTAKVSCNPTYKWEPSDTPGHLDLEDCDVDTQINDVLVFDSENDSDMTVQEFLDDFNLPTNFMDKVKEQIKNDLWYGDSYRYLITEYKRNDWALDRDLESRYGY